MMKIISIAFVSLSLSILQVRADEGMWTFDNPPLKQWKEKYAFEPTAEWLEHVRLASAHVGASASFVSPNGLLVTNQHVAAGVLAKISSKEKDYTKDGFYAPKRELEVKSPDSEVKVLWSYENVTKRVKAAVTAGATVEDAAKQRKAAIALIEKESSEATGLDSKVVALYNGGEYWLYRHKKYTDLRLVFATEEQVAFFGGDYDNFTYPRHDLDVAFARVYENGVPIKTPHYFKWSQKGPNNNEFVMAIGSPFNTDRLLTVDQLINQRDFANPILEEVLNAKLKALSEYGKRGEEENRQAGSALRGINNTLKRLKGQQDGLMNPRLFGRKQAQEKALRDHVAKNPQLLGEIKNPWQQISNVYKLLPGKAKQLAYSNLSPSRLATIALSIVRYSDQMKKPNEQRYEEFRDSALDSFKLGLFSSAPIYPELEIAVLAAWLESCVKALGPNDPFVRAAIGKEKISDLVRRAVLETKLDDVEVRRKLIESSELMQSSLDPMLVLAKRVEPIIRELREWQEEKVTSVVTSAGEKIAKARFAVYGRTVAPDANSNVRMSFGTVSGYSEDTTLVPYMTTFYGLFDRNVSFENKPPYNLPSNWRDAAKRLDLSTGLNFVYSADTIGGNSGSPVINREGELVGINFDSNLQKISNRYWYVDEEEGSRAVAVHSAGVLRALKEIYKADALVDELLGQKSM